MTKKNANIEILKALLEVKDGHKMVVRFDPDAFMEDEQAENDYNLDIYIDDGVIVIAPSNKCLNLVDQNGNDIPEDLMIMPDFDSLEQEDREKIFAANWYKYSDVLLVSYAEVGDLAGTLPEDIGIDLQNAKIIYIDNVLKRGSLEDGFYHA
jgi:hypothetical protein